MNDKFNRPRFGMSSDFLWLAIDSILVCSRNHYLSAYSKLKIKGSVSSAMSESHSFGVPVSAKPRPYQPSHKTLELSQRIEASGHASGAAWITSHARTVSARRCQGKLERNQTLNDHLRIPVISN